MKKQPTSSDDKRLQIESIETDILHDIAGGPVDGEALGGGGAGHQTGG